MGAARHREVSLATVTRLHVPAYKLLDRTSSRTRTNLVGVYSAAMLIPGLLACVLFYRVALLSVTALIRTASP